MVDTPHPDLTDPDIHEPKGASSASDGQLYFADGAGSGAWDDPDVPVFMQKHIAGLTFQNAADATNDFTILAGSARDVTNTEDMVLTNSITKRLDANWVVGDNQGGLDAGSVSATAYYHIWLIKRVDTGVVDVLFSTSASAPTMPTNYTKKRRIGSFLRVSGTNRAQTVIEVGGGAIRIHYTSPTQETPVACAATGTVIQLGYIPSGVFFEAQVMWNTSSDTTVHYSAITSGFGALGNIGSLSITQSDRTNLNPGTGDSSAGYINAGLANVMTNASSQIIGYDTSSLNITCTVLGFTDFRRD